MRVESCFYVDHNRMILVQFPVQPSSYCCDLRWCASRWLSLFDGLEQAAN